MSNFFPMTVSCTIVGFGVTEEHATKGESLCSERTFDLVLRAHLSTMIRLSTGEHLKDVDINFSLSAKWSTPEALDRDLQPKDVGFLTHIRESLGPLSNEEGPPFVHGAAIWPSSYLPDALLNPKIEGHVAFTLSSVPFIMDDEEPFIWHCNRPHKIRIARISVTAVRHVTDDESQS